MLEAHIHTAMLIFNPVLRRSLQRMALLVRRGTNSIELSRVRLWGCQKTCTAGAQGHLHRVWTCLLLFLHQDAATWLRLIVSIVLANPRCRLPSFYVLIWLLRVDSWVECAWHCTSLLRYFHGVILHGVPAVLNPFCPLHHVSDKRRTSSIHKLRRLIWHPIIVAKAL